MPDAELLILRVSSSGPRRLDLLVLEALRQRDSKTPISRGLLKRFFRRNPPLLDGALVPSPSVELEGRHTVALSGWSEFLAKASVLLPAERCFLPILYEDEDLLILSKDAGVPSVALSGDETHTAVAAALARVPALASIEGAKPLEPGLLHRLDTATSGILAFAKSAAEFARLRALWKTPAVRKIYRAKVEILPGALPPSACTLREPIGHSASSAGRMVVLPANGAPGEAAAIRGQALPAVTHIRRVSPLSEGGFELEIEIETGVMHQIRAHLASRGWPIIGDRVYNPTARPTRLMLHAWKLEVPLRSGTQLELTSLEK